MHIWKEAIHGNRHGQDADNELGIQSALSKKVVFGGKT